MGAPVREAPAVATIWSHAFPGLVMRACRDVDGAFEVHNETGRSLRIGGEAYLCFDCGPDGGVYHPEDRDAEGPTFTLAEVREIAARFDRHFNRFVVHRHHTFVDGRDGPAILHSHTDGGEAHRHPDTATAWFGHRGEGAEKPTRAPSGPQLPLVELTEAERTFRVVGRYEYLNPAESGGPSRGGSGAKPSAEWSRAAWRQTMELTVWAARLRLYGHDSRLVGPGAVTIAANRLADSFGLTPIYEIEGWQPTPFTGLP